MASSMTQHATPTLLAVDSSGRGLSVSFFRLSDRWAHTVQVVDRSSSDLLLRSTDAVQEEAWPSSPALQELLEERRSEEGAVLLLVGQAGKTHWSLSVEANSQKRCLRFDVACRLKQPPELLGSRYEATATLSAGASVDQACLSPRQGLVTIDALAFGSSEEATRLSFDTTECSIQPVSDSCQPPCTIRWQYDISLAATS